MLVAWAVAIRYCAFYPFVSAIIKTSRSIPSRCFSYNRRTASNAALVNPHHFLTRLDSSFRRLRIHRSVYSQFTSVKMSNEEAKEFDAVFHEIVNGLCFDFSQPDLVPAIEWLKNVFDYNVPFGKKTRGMFVVKGFKLMAAPIDLTPENLHLATVLGWCVEMLQGYFLIADDLMDQAQTRRGNPCWYKRENVGLSAINDSFSLSLSVNMILKKYFSHKSYYLNLLETFSEITFLTSLGQSLDLSVSKQFDLNKFTMETYSAIVKYKTAFYSFYLPIALAMYMSGIKDQSRHEEAKSISLEMGYLFQVQDDYLDCFGDPELTGKIGTDIEEGKCTWLVVTALQKANDDQMNILKKHYGQNSSEDKARVKSLYEELDLPGVFEEFEESCYGRIFSRIEKVKNDLPSVMFFELARVIYKRKR